MEQLRWVGGAQSYTVQGLFKSGRLGDAEEAAMGEIASISSGFRALGRRPSDLNDSNFPDVLDMPDVWRRYKLWRKRWNQVIIHPGPKHPWGVTVAALVESLITEPHGIESYAPYVGDVGRSGVHPGVLGGILTRCLQDYGSLCVSGWQENNIEWEVEQIRYAQQRQSELANSRTFKQRQRWPRASDRYYSKNATKH